MPFTIWDFFPASFNCPHSINRLGRMGDGGRWFCGIEKLTDLPRDREARPEAPASPEVVKIRQLTTGHAREPGPDSQPGCIVYSLGGIRNESSFEAQLLQRTPHCEIWGYDEHERSNITDELVGLSLAHGDEEEDEEGTRGRGRVHFARAGVAAKSNAGTPVPLVSIQDLMAANGHDHIDVLKVDVEPGREFQALGSVVAHFRDRGRHVPVAQLLVTVHLVPELDGVDDLVGWWERLEEAGFRPVWMEHKFLPVTT